MRSWGGGRAGPLERGSYKILCLADVPEPPPPFLACLPPPLSRGGQVQVLQFFTGKSRGVEKREQLNE